MTVVHPAPSRDAAPPARSRRTTAPPPSATRAVAVSRNRALPMIVQRMSRCLFVSVGTTVLSTAVLLALALGAGVSAGSANVVAVCCGIGPSYVANRRWVWSRSGNGDLVKEILPFWMLSIAGLVVSTMAVSLVASAGVHWSTSVRALALPLANLSVFGALWLVQFALLDKVLFRVVPNGPVPNQPVPNEPVPDEAVSKEFPS